MPGRLNVVKVSSRYRVVIPASVRARVRVHPGQKMLVLAWQDRIELIPARPARRLRGFAHGIDTAVDRGQDRP